MPKNVNALRENTQKKIERLLKLELALNFGTLFGPAKYKNQTSAPNAAQGN